MNLGSMISPNLMNISCSFPCLVWINFTFSSLPCPRSVSKFVSPSKPCWRPLSNDTFSSHGDHGLHLTQSRVQSVLKFQSCLSYSQKVTVELLYFPMRLQHWTWCVYLVNWLKNCWLSSIIFQFWVLYSVCFTCISSINSCYQKSLFSVAAI